MKTRLHIAPAIAGLVFAAGAAAQQAAPIAGQVPGTTLQLWLDQNVAFAGIHHASGCYFMNAAKGKDRVLFLSCPDGSTLSLQGMVRVTGNEWCTSFPQPVGDECRTWHVLPDGRYAQRRGDLTSASMFVLSIVPTKVAGR